MNDWHLIVTVQIILFAVKLQMSVDFKLLDVMDVPFAANVQHLNVVLSIARVADFELEFQV